MKSVLIPPIPHLGVAAGRPIHLTLAHLYNESTQYLQFYQAEALKGSYVILDNSAHEFGEGQEINLLIQRARQVGAKELVLPDHLFDGPDTLARSSEALSYLTKLDHSLEEPLRYMIVPQGQTHKEFLQCLVRLAEAYYDAQESRPDIFKYTPVIGVSKDYEMWQGGLLKLLRKDIIPIADDYQAMIHLLGWGRKLWDLGDIALAYGDRIRSVDSAKPFVYGRSLKILSLRDEIPEYPKRSPTFFTDPLNLLQLDASMVNVRVFDSLVSLD
jgi:hypothetical protein